MINSFLICTIISVLFSLGTGALIFRRRNILVAVVMGSIFFFCSYILSTMTLFVTDRYTLFRGIAVTAIFDIIIFTAVLIVKAPRTVSFKELFSFDWDIRKLLIPIVISVIAIPFAANKNEIFGMGQDEGVYQCVAINLMNGLDDRQQDFEEYHLLATDESRENFQWFVTNKLVGYDIPNELYPDTVYDRNISEVSGIYHGIPTYAAILALWGELFGMENMADVQTVFLILTIFLVCFICMNLNLKPSSQIAAAALTALSPIVIWVAKSSLTEMFLAVLVALFIYLLTDSGHSEMQALSIVPIAVFGCYHVSIYTMLPYVLICYGGMYFLTKRKTFAVLMPVTVIGYLLSYFMMRHVQPFYTMNNYRVVFVGGINVHNISAAVTVVCVILLVLLAAFILIVSKMKKSTEYTSFVSDKKNQLIMKLLLVAMLILPLLFIIYKSFSSFESVKEAGHLAIVGFVANSGIVILPLGLIFALVNSKVFLADKERLIIFISFFYCVLVYSAFLRFEIDYYYYYARYLVPFIPAAVLFAVTAMDRVGGRLIIPAAALSLIYTAPYSNYLAHNVDDTRMEWETLSDITQHIEVDDCVVIDRPDAATLWLPVRAITKAHVYPLEDAMEEQLASLGERYNNVYLISSTSYTYNLENNMEIVYMDSVHGMEDKSKDWEHWIPLPESFTEKESNLFMYRLMNTNHIYDADLISFWRISGIGEVEGYFCWTNEENSSMRCTLDAEDYELTVDLGGVIPLNELSKTYMKVDLIVNNTKVDSAYITSKNNGDSLTFEIPAEYLNEGSNAIGFETDLWSASVVSPNDERMLGIPLRSLVFEPSE